MVKEIISIEHLRQMMARDVTRIPDFIDTSIFTHRLIWGHMRNYIINLSKLTNPKLLSKQKIQSVIIENDIETDELVSLCSVDLMNLIILWAWEKTSNYFNYAEQQELFEICSNFKKYQDLNGSK